MVDPGERRIRNRLIDVLQEADSPARSGVPARFFFRLRRREPRHRSKKENSGGGGKPSLEHGKTAEMK